MFATNGNHLINIFHIRNRKSVDHSIGETTVVRIQFVSSDCCCLLSIYHAINLDGFMSECYQLNCLPFSYPSDNTCMQIHCCKISKSHSRCRLFKMIRNKMICPKLEDVTLFARTFLNLILLGH